MTDTLNSSKYPYEDPLIFYGSSESVINIQDIIFRSIESNSISSEYLEDPYRSTKNTQLKGQVETTVPVQIKEKIGNIKPSSEFNNKKQFQNQQALLQNKPQFRTGQQLTKQKKFNELKKQLEKVCRKKCCEDILYYYNEQAKFKKNNFKKSIGKLFIKQVKKKIKEESLYPTEWIEKMKKVIKKYTRKDTNKSRSFSNSQMSQILCSDKEEYQKYSRINLKILSEVTRDCETIQKKIIITGHGKAFNTIKYMREAKKLNLMCRSATLIKNYFRIDDRCQT